MYLPFVIPPVDSGPHSKAALLACGLRLHMRTALERLQGGMVHLRRYYHRNHSTSIWNGIISKVPIEAEK